MKRYSFKQKLGVILFDWPAFEYKLRSLSKSASHHPAWVDICNRNESLTKAPNGWGVSCSWKWSSELYAAKVFPCLGARLMKKALADWPVRLNAMPSISSGNPDISFIIGHRGLERQPLLGVVLKTIAAQRGVAWECIVVEQSVKPMLKSVLPCWVRYIHTQLPYPEMPYCRSWAFNAGARQAKGKLLVLLDNDILIPEDYSIQLIKQYDEGYEVINLKRYVFRLNKTHTEQIVSTGNFNQKIVPETILQNVEAGCNVAVSKDAYLNIGGFDEKFIGWGGEDNEFWERAQTRSVWPYAYLPVVHLWHQNQPGKSDAKETMAIKRYRQLSQISPEIRIERLLNDASEKSKFV